MNGFAMLLTGYRVGSALAIIGKVISSATVITLVMVLLAVVYTFWVAVVRRQKVAHAELEKMQSEQNNAAALEIWPEGIYPACLALYTANQLCSSISDPFLV